MPYLLQNASTNGPGTPVSASGVQIVGLRGPMDSGVAVTLQWSGDGGGNWHAIGGLAPGSNLLNLGDVAVSVRANLQGVPAGGSTLVNVLMGSSS